jgi:hypothetical protein
MMNSLDPINLPKQVVLSIFAALLLQTHDTRAVDLQVDAQTQARDLLSGAVGGRPKTIDGSTRIAPEDRSSPTLDPQAQARRLILGNPDFGTAAHPSVASVASVASDSRIKLTSLATAQVRRRGHSDPQELAQRMILH